MFFSKHNWDENEQQIDFTELVVAAGTNPTYFKPYKIGDSFYISSSIISISPALYAYYYAREVAEIKDNVRITSIGSTKFKPESFNVIEDTYQWDQRLNFLIDPINKSSQDKILEKIFDNQDHDFFKFDIPLSMEAEQNIRYQSARINNLK